MPERMITAMRRCIVEALRDSHGNRDKAAITLDIGRNTLYRHIRDLEIHPSEYLADYDAPIRAKAAGA